jgi:3-methyladenine DNA glycosylase/8-oxoguanine DNA glycosylase
MQRGTRAAAEPLNGVKPHIESVAGAERRLPRERVDLNLTLGWYRNGGLDPTSHREHNLFVKAFHTSEGPVTLEISQVPGEWLLRAWGPGRQWVLERAERMLSPTDPDLPDCCALPLKRLAFQGRGLRVVRVPWVEDIVVSTILQQRVTTGEAFRTYRYMANLKPQPAPGPYRLLLPPRPHRQGNMAVLGRMGLCEKRAGTLMRLRHLESGLLRAVELEVEQFRAWLMQVPGIGPWTCELVMGMGMGDADALPTGDLHFPHIVSEKLTGVGWSNDEEMVKLLEPYRPCRFRVLRLLVGKVPAA